MKIKALIFTIVFFNFTTVFSQDIQFTSYITDKYSFAPIADATISINKLNTQVKSNSEGKFSFTTTITNGQFIATVKHKNYITTDFLIEFIDGFPKEIENILLEVNYEEGLKRRRITQKENISRARKQKKLLKERKKKEKLLAKLNRKRNQTIVDYEPEIKPKTVETVTKIVENETFRDIQYKYAKILNVSIENLSNNTLYTFIDQSINEPNEPLKSNISFLNQLYPTAYNLNIETSIMLLYESEYTEKFNGKEYLTEGDLLFFNETGDNTQDITHVAMYLHNNKFIHYSKNKGATISELDSDYWSKRYVSAGRRINNQ